MNRRAFVKGLSAAALLPGLHEPLALLARAQGPRPPGPIGWPSSATVPALGLIIPNSARMVVVLPAPLSPRKA